MAKYNRHKGNKIRKEILEAIHVGNSKYHDPCIALKIKGCPGIPYYQFRDTDDDEDKFDLPRRSKQEIDDRKIWFILGSIVQDPQSTNQKKYYDNMVKAIYDAGYSINNIGQLVGKNLQTTLDKNVDPKNVTLYFYTYGGDEEDLKII